MGFFSRFRKQPEPTSKVEGLLGYYGLGEWWLITFSAKEREEIEAMWGYITVQGHPITNERQLTRGRVASNPLTPAEFLMVVSSRVLDKKVHARFLDKARELRGGELPGYIQGKSYTTYMDRAKGLIEAGKVEAADPIVDVAFTAFEEQERVGMSLVEVSAPPPAPYEQFAILYRKHKDYAREVMILERYARQPHSPGKKPPQLAERLEKARALLGKQRASDS